MATYVKGDAVENAIRYDLYDVFNGETNKIAEATDINFEVSAMTLEAGDHVFRVQAIGDGTNYADSELSEPTDTYTVEGEPYVLDVASIPSGTDYTLDNLYTESIFEVTTRRWLSDAGVYELSSFPYNNAEYLLCRIDLTELKNRGYSKVSFSTSDNTSYYSYSTSYENTWLSSVSRLVSDGTAIDISDKAILYLGIRRIKTDGTITLYYGSSLTATFE